MSKNKRRQLVRNGYTYTLNDSGPPSSNNFIKSVINPFYNDEKLSLGDTVLIRFHTDIPAGSQGIIEKISFVEDNKNKTDILSIRVPKKGVVSAGLAQVKRLPPHPVNN